MISIRGLLSRLEQPSWNHDDILDHPDLRRMSLRELGDLPMPRIEAGREPAAPVVSGQDRARQT